MIKYGVMTEQSVGDFDLTKKAEYYDQEGYQVADAENKNKLKKPCKIEQDQEQSNEHLR